MQTSLYGVTWLKYVTTDPYLQLSKASYMHLNSRLYTALRGILVSQIYKKTLLINKIEASKSTAVTLTNTDIEGMATGVEKLTEMWVGIIETLAGVYALSRVIDRASLSVALPAIRTCTTSFTWIHSKAYLTF